MATTELTAQNFEQTVLDNGTVFVDFWAEWCGPCLRFGPVYEDVSEQHGVLAVQGPSSRVILAELDPRVGHLEYFGLTKAKIGGKGFAG